MELQEIIIAGIIIIVAALILGFLFSPNDAQDTCIHILNKGDLGSNSTIYVKLTDNKKISLSEKTINIKLIDKNGTVVYNKYVETHATGVAMAQLSDINTGNYTLVVKFEGDSNYSTSSASKQVNIIGGVVQDVIDNSTLDAATIRDITTSQSQSQSQSSTSYDTPSSSTDSSSSSSQSSSSSSQSSSSSDDEDLPYVDENGNEYLPTYDENGKEVEPE